MTNPDGLEQFISLCISAKNPKKLAALFQLFLTAEERENISTRLLIIKELLVKENTQREIAKKLNVSIAKITRGSNELKRMDKQLLKFIIENL